MAQEDLKKKLFDENVPNLLILMSLLLVSLMKTMALQPTKVCALIFDLNNFNLLTTESDPFDPANLYCYEKLKIIRNFSKCYDSKWIS